MQEPKNAMSTLQLTGGMSPVLLMSSKSITGIRSLKTKRVSAFVTFSSKKPIFTSPQPMKTIRNSGVESCSCKRKSSVTVRLPVVSSSLGN